MPSSTSGNEGGPPAGFDDVRMRGFRARSDFDEVAAWLDARPAPSGDESVALEQAVGRVLASDLVSEVAVPRFPRAAMDGWAVRGRETFGASERDPMHLRVLGRARPGHPFEGTVGPGQAVRIMTGAPLPDGADAVLRAEEGYEKAMQLEVRAAAPPQRHVGARGEDVQPGDLVVASNRPLRPQDVGMAAALGHTTLRVRRKPQACVVVTGDEVQAPGTALGTSSIYDANGAMLDALLARDGAALAPRQHATDSPEAARQAIETATQAGDLVVITGGSSVGEEDHAPRLVAAMGELAFHGVAIRPAAPTGVGIVAGRLVFLLPGNPVSCLSAYDLLVAGVVRRWTHRPGRWPYREARGVLSRKVASALGRLDYVRVRIEGETITPVMSRGASILSSTTQSDGFLLVPAASEGWPEGTSVQVWRYD